MTFSWSIDCNVLLGRAASRLRWLAASKALQLVHLKPRSSCPCTYTVVLLSPWTLGD